MNDFFKNKNNSKKINNVKKESGPSPTAPSDSMGSSKLSEETKENIKYFATGITILIFSLIWWHWGNSLCQDAMPNLEPLKVKIVSDLIYVCIVGIIYFLFVEKFGISGQMPAVIIIVVLFLIIDIINFASEPPKNNQEEKPTQEVLYINEQRNIPLLLDSFQEFPPQIYVEEGFTITFNSPKGTDFYIIMHDHGDKVVHMVKDDQPLPEIIGRFSIRNGQKKCKIMVIVY